MTKGERSFEKVILFFATLGFTGFFPKIPGTIGTLVGAVVYLALYPIHPLLYGLDLMVWIFFASWVSEKAEGILGEKDSRVIVIDELVGFLITLFWIPPSLKGIALGVVLFRLFDISKAPPMGWIERSIPGGYGVVLDDVVAGIYSNLALRIILLFWS